MTRPVNPVDTLSGGLICPFAWSKPRQVFERVYGGGVVVQRTTTGAARWLLQPPAGAPTAAHPFVSTITLLPLLLVLNLPAVIVFCGNPSATRSSFTSATTVRVSEATVDCARTHIWPSPFESQMQGVIVPVAAGYDVESSAARV